MPAAHFAAVAGRLPELAFFAPAGAGVLVPATPGALAEHHQTWALDPVAEVWRLDVFREPHEGDTWVSRRHASQRRPYSEIVRRTPDGIPYLSPDVALFFKAKHTRPKDQEDYDAVAPTLTAAERAWLDEALDLVHPGHAWRS